MLNSPSVSVITWDGGFREHFHTVDFFCRQTSCPPEFEFLWIEYYAEINRKLAEKIDRYKNAHAYCMRRTGEWHVGMCMNEGIKISKGEHLVLIDGDIAVSDQFLQADMEIHRKYPDTAVYYRRWDEPKPVLPDSNRKISIDYLESVCRLENPENYGGCLSISRKLMQDVLGYEEHNIFSGPGAISRELYIRLANAGIPILWHPDEKIYHPWHTGTIPLYKTDKVRLQKEVISKRGLALQKYADPDQAEMYVRQARKLAGQEKSLAKKIISIFR